MSPQSNRPCVLGIDTSNYTTSLALYNIEDNSVEHIRKLLPVKDGSIGLRQSDAVFHHTQQLPKLFKELFANLDNNAEIKAIGVSVAPRDGQGSYMPCFTVGSGAAEILGTALSVPVYRFSHQSGHIAAAIYSSKHFELFGERFLAFHVSGGTTEAVIVEPDDDNIFHVTPVGKSLDLHAGQAVDRVGVSLGLSFPCGAELEKLALNCKDKVTVKPCIKGTDCCLSGVENICAKMLDEGVNHPKIALTCLKYIGESIGGMCDAALKEYGDMKVLFAGGVMSNSIIRTDLSSRFNCVFSKPEFSSDNACGTSVLAAKKYFKENKK